MTNEADLLAYRMYSRVTYVRESAVRAWLERPHLLSRMVSSGVGCDVACQDAGRGREVPDRRPDAGR